MLTVQILTRNNQNTIQATLESIVHLNPKILIGDFDSTDNTVSICKKYGAQIFNVTKKSRNEARSFLLYQNPSKYNLWIEPWETILQKSSDYTQFDSEFGFVRIVQGQIITWEIRLWKKECRFVNPIFERVDSEIGTNTNMVLSSQGSLDTHYCMDKLQKWKLDEPLSNQPYYYQACLLLSDGKYDDFLSIADHYLFKEKQPTASVIMLRYYYAMVQLMQKKAVRPALQNLNLCLCAKPLMAEFWCLTGDVYYHLLHKFTLAKEFYQNAILLGSKRLRSERWPMDVSKYRKYPLMMIDSCDKIMNTKADYVMNKSV